jgi:lipopolysaccharide export system protein LptC
VSKRQTLLFILMLVVVISSGLFLNDQDPRLRPTTVSATGPDSFVTDMELHVMDRSGRLQYRLRSASMVHYPDEERIDLEHPVIDVNQQHGSVWHITADQGQSTDSGDRVWLRGTVDIRRPAGPSVSPLHIRTSDMLVQPKVSLAETDRPARITGENYRIDTTGLKADFRKKQLELRSRVRSTINGEG